MTDGRKSMPATQVDGFVFPELPRGWGPEDIRKRLVRRITLHEWDAIEHQYNLRAKEVLGDRLRGCVQPPGSEQFHFFTVRHETNSDEVIKVRLDWQEMFCVSRK